MTSRTDPFSFLKAFASQSLIVLESDDAINAMLQYVSVSLEALRTCPRRKGCYHCASFMRGAYAEKSHQISCGSHPFQIYHSQMPTFVGPVLNFY